MIKFNKTTLFVIIFITSVCAGISLNLINWNNVDSGLSFMKEFHLTFLLSAIALYFVFPFIKSLKESK
jgi:hypothetical protein